MRTPRRLLTSLLALGLLLPACQLPLRPSEQMRVDPMPVSMEPPPSETVFRVYDLGEMVPGGVLEAEEMRTFIAMIRDAVGQEAWVDVNSTIHVLGNVLLIRTTTTGHDSLATFFGQFRSISGKL